MGMFVEIKLLYLYLYFVREMCHNQNNEYRDPSGTDAVGGPFLPVTKLALIFNSKSRRKKSQISFHSISTKIQ